MKNNYSIAQRNAIVEANLWCIDSVIRQNRPLMRAARLEYDDVYQQLALRLIKAVAGYDPEKGRLEQHIFAQLKYELLSCRSAYRLCGMAVSDRKYLGYYPIAQAKAWLSGHDKVESCDLLALKNYLWRLPSDREKVEAVLTRLCVNPMQDKVNDIRGMALESQEEFDAALGDGSKADTARKAFIKLRGELTHLYQMQCSLRTAAQSDSETALVDDLLADLEKISRKAHEQTHFTYTTLEEIAALN